MVLKYLKIPVLMGVVILSGMQGAQSDEARSVDPVLHQNEGFAGKYLSSHFAQNRHDWSTANGYLSQILTDDFENIELIRRSMILAMGSGDLTLAAQRATALTTVETEDGLALMILAVNDMVHGKMDLAVESLNRMEKGDMTNFIKPILKGWVAADQGTLDVEEFNETTIHNYHAGLLSVFLDEEESLAVYIEALIGAGALSKIDAERTADLLAASDRFKEAAVLYEGVYVQDSHNKLLGDKLAAVQKENGGNIKDLIEALQIKKPQEGAALAMYDMAFILYQEHSDSSAKLFSYMALALHPDMVNAQLILADILARNDRFEEAIRQLDKVPEGHVSYLAVQRHAAELLSEAGRHDEALQKLNELFIGHNDVEALIQIGDLYRHEEKFTSALTAYNKAAGHIGKDVPEEYWYLLYARGMAYEREGIWSKAETDLKAALVYRPDHPYLLNYLGYAWADQGLNLEESLELIERAVSLRPRDGYIIDSLGWAQYMMGRYDEALPNLEHAVELLPYDTTINDHLGDAYWRAGRLTEARFQWERALNYGDGEENPLQEKLEHKLRFGPDAAQTVSE